MLSNMKFNMLKMTGQIVQVLLMPAEFGGEPIGPNIIWMYKAAAQEKAKFDQETVELVRESDDEWQYSARPTYEGEDSMPLELTLNAWSHGGDKLERVIRNSTDAAITSSWKRSGNFEKPPPTNVKPETLGEGLIARAAPGDPTRAQSIGDLLHEHVAASFDKQLQLAEQLGEGWSWSLELPTATLTISHHSGQKSTFPVQVLGSESDGSKSWLWSWANMQSNLPSYVLTSAESLRQFGKAHDVPEFVEPQLNLENIPAELIAMIAVGLCCSRGYFRGPYKGGAVYLLLDETLPISPSLHPVTRMTSVFPQLLQTLPVENHQRAFEYYTNYYGFEVSSAPSKMTADHPVFGSLKADFDNLRRLINLQASMEPVRIA